MRCRIMVTQMQVEDPILVGGDPFQQDDHVQSTNGVPDLRGRRVIEASFFQTVARKPEKHSFDSL
jgi:hypothetical protein